MPQCIVCSKEATYTYCSLSCSNKDRIRKNELVYNKHPKLCRQCSGPIPYLKRFSNAFCSSSCAATFNNKLHPKRVKLPKPPKSDISLEKFLLGQLITRQSIRKILIRTRGNQCALCSLPGIWQDEPITLITDHIDGNAGNHLPNNVRLLCPNCDSQTPTFSGRNKGHGRKSRGLPR